MKSIQQKIDFLNGIAQISKKQKLKINEKPDMRERIVPFQQDS